MVYGFSLSSEVQVLDQRISRFLGLKYVEGEGILLALSSSFVCCLGSVARVLFRTMDLLVNSCRLSSWSPPCQRVLSVCHNGS